MKISTIKNPWYIFLLDKKRGYHWPWRPNYKLDALNYKQTYYNTPRVNIRCYCSDFIIWETVHAQVKCHGWKFLYVLHFYAQHQSTQYFVTNLALTAWPVWQLSIGWLKLFTFFHTMWSLANLIWIWCNDDIMNKIQVFIL